MTYEISELIEVGEAGSTIQADKAKFVDEISGIRGPEEPALEEE
jgi:hypothetical protein